ncbi:MAG: bifunctional alpha,alpha-trehalose-phosphate synthase (UDP-forming)/trehalose-phosphatase [Acidobacteriota bacterium]
MLLSDLPAPSRPRPEVKGSPRLICVSNRLPITVRVDHGRPSLVRSSGGLATALCDGHQKAGGVWIGWPGVTGSLDAPEFACVRETMAADRLVAVELSAADVKGYYEDFSNGVIWPLFHYLLDRVPVAEHGWRQYQRINEKFADVVASHYRAGDLVWVHDYHLMLVPRLLRQRIPDARIAFFLHIPFPSSEVFRILPWRTEILQGLLGADLIGLHTYGYVRHLAMAVLHILGVEPAVDCVRYQGRDIRLQARPVGIDAASFEALAATPEVRAEADAIRRASGGRRLLLGVDRLDYTKGLPRRLLAVERLLAQPEWRDRVRLIQVAIPTRDRVESYRGFKRTVEQFVGRVNGECGTVEALPVHYLYGTVPFPRLVALYLAADVMVVTPLRDGLNLVAKEFVASRVDDDGVLVLSEFAGSACELGEAVIVNPYDVDGMVTALDLALRMPAAERTMRMRALRARVSENTVERWVDGFARTLAETPRTACPPEHPLQPEALHRTLRPMLTARPLALVLDYDGTLVPIASTPNQAIPNQRLLRLLGQLADRPDTVVHIVSGRPRELLEAWFGALPIALWAEHGFWHRARNGTTWLAAAQELPDGWRRKVEPILEHFTAATPGSFIEFKSASMAWHYRLADDEVGTRAAHELRMLLGDALSNQPLEVREGKKVLEVRMRGVHKGFAIERMVSAADGPAAIIAAGDDASDEEMFAALPSGSAAIHVGEGCSRAAFWLSSSDDVREWLELILETDPRPLTGAAGPASTAEERPIGGRRDGGNRPPAGVAQPGITSSSQPDSDRTDHRGSPE